jgi:hypothetical protein
MDVSRVSRAVGWSRTAGSSAAPQTRPRVAAEETPRREGNFVRGAIIGLILVAPFWVAVAYFFIRLLR